MIRFALAALLLGCPVVSPLVRAQEARPALADAWEKTGELAAAEAVQAAAADERFVYAINNSMVAKYDRDSGQRVAVSSGPAKHLNSGFFHEGKLCCAHSNYPRKPEQSELKVLDPQTMELTTLKDFGNFGGSLTWAVFHEGHWWCNFALYGKDNAKTFLVRFTPDWNEVARYTYPAEIISELKSYSLSGGIWHEGRLLVTDHDHRVLYEIALPQPGSSVLQLAGKHRAPFTGQGIAADPKTGGLVGIDRGKKRIVFAELGQE